MKLIETSTGKFFPVDDHLAPLFNERGYGSQFLLWVASIGIQNVTVRRIPRQTWPDVRDSWKIEHWNELVGTATLHSLKNGFFFGDKLLAMVPDFYVESVSFNSVTLDRYGNIDISVATGQDIKNVCHLAELYHHPL